MCYFVMLMSSLLFYNVENSKSKEKPLNELVCPIFMCTLLLYHCYHSTLLLPYYHCVIRCVLSLFIETTNTRSLLLHVCFVGVPFWCVQCGCVLYFCLLLIITTPSNRGAGTIVHIVPLPETFTSWWCSLT
jgi:cellulose synthase/poly-beta-1,6-N-acetylglucosamine synthase-like glycosyltransferase